jgi:NADP-dependent 3-hydroxy acid dehydrogenase YdfG
LSGDQEHLRISLDGLTAVVTGGSSGIGRAIALSLAACGAHVGIVGRSSERLAETAGAAQNFSTLKTFQLDLANDRNIAPLVAHVQKTGKLDILVHAAGAIREGTMEQASVDDLDRQYAINVRAPYALSQRLLPFLIAARGQIVFINSSVGLSVKRAEVAQYAATKHALRAIADSLREEVNSKGIRVLTLFLGRTATPMQEKLYHLAQKPYQPETLIQPADIGSVVVHAITLPSTVEITDIYLRPMQKSS